MSQQPDLITPARAAEIKDAALRHAGRMILVSVGEWAPKEFAANDARNDAEADLLVEEVERIAREILDRRRPRGRRACSVCGLDYLVRRDGRIGHHHGMDPAGFSTGSRCAGVGEPPAASQE
ncbi:hypothetical protein ACIGD1_11380 [Streptomyces sp. NPDC085612]|uniref:hypothetical protein n=1 Tax=Streptomyces sp. NPDC085612 TaxID=3365732 RepID=UPI0037CED7D6